MGTVSDQLDNLARINTRIVDALYDEAAESRLAQTA